MAQMLTIRQMAERLKEEQLPVSEYTLRILVKRGVIPVRYVGSKALLYAPKVLNYFMCSDGCDNAPSMVAASGIRRVAL